MTSFLRRLFGGTEAASERRAEEDPKVVLERGLAALERELRRAEEASRVVVALRRDLERHRAQADEVVARNTRQAERAVALGRDDLARQSLALRREVEQERGDIEERISEVTRQQAALEAARDNLRLHMEQLRSRETEMGTNLAAAQAQLRLREAMAATSDDAASVARSLERLEERLEATRARAEALEELEPGPGTQGRGDTLDRELNQLERAQRVDREFDRVKREALEQKRAREAKEGERGGSQP